MIKNFVHEYTKNRVRCNSQSAFAAEATTSSSRYSTLAGPMRKNYSNFDAD